ncbi:alanine--tRNA ligase [Candidatus Woesearchaeota archaeon]|nr:alanine--tRNA ligase [Candidatus Woesearchaeota archaeon]
MRPDKVVKKEFKLKASKSPDSYYATSVLKQQGFMRKQCKCGTFFWTVNPEQKTCGDPACTGGFGFIGSTPAKKEMDYVEVWQEFSRLFRKKGYTPIPRYPVVARWRDDTYFVKASIYDFQPYVVSGEVEPPANPLVVPQLCLRFNDIDNIGITGAHYSCFDMIGQHAFLPEDKWDQGKVFGDIHDWLKTGLGLPDEEITFHEDAWAGGGNFGPCMEYFSRGLELGNQVYMLYEQTPSGDKPLKLKVLDMGMGHERNAWFSKGTSTSYDTTFPNVTKKLYKLTGVNHDTQLLKSFLPYSSNLNVDEVDDINKAWGQISKKLGVSTAELKRTIIPLSKLYSVADHSRALLVALSDGALPSNVGDAYNLRVLLRRALSFIDQEAWDVDMHDLFETHARYLKPIYPELLENLENVKKIFNVEKEKYNATKQKSRAIVARLIKEGGVTEDKLLQLYDSHGISPELIAHEAAKEGKEVIIPDDFYAKVTELHDNVEQVHATAREDDHKFDHLPETKILYYDDYAKIEFDATVIGVTEGTSVGEFKDRKIRSCSLCLDQTAFYPTSGGQLHDIGTIDGFQVKEVYKTGKLVRHIINIENCNQIPFENGQKVNAKIDFKRRLQLTQHHTETHIINAAARAVLGSHINQAGAKKTTEKAHLDITHYQNVTEDEIKAIEDEANRIVKAAIPIRTRFMPRSEAEKQYGMALYQGGAVPGKKIRVVEIAGVDVEACGGTHLHNTSEVGKIRIIRSAKVQDGIVRLTFIAGEALEQISTSQGDLLMQVASSVDVTPEQLPARAEELFELWKRCKKAKKKGKALSDGELKLVRIEAYKGDALARTAEILRTQPEHVLNTIKRFLDDIEQYKKQRDALLDAPDKQSG